MVNSLDSNKPVAWVEVASDGTILGVSLDKDDTSPFILRPLYTAPVAQPKNEPDVFNKARFEKSPCYICGYNGPGYYQSDVHKCAAIYHGDVAQPADRTVFKAFALSQGFVDAEGAWKNRGAAQPDAEKVRRLLQEVMGCHADPADAFYNECDKGLCGWCEQAADILAKLGERK